MPTRLSKNTAVNKNGGRWVAVFRSGQGPISKFDAARRIVRQAGLRRASALRATIFFGAAFLTSRPFSATGFFSAGFSSQKFWSL